MAEGILHSTLREVEWKTFPNLITYRGYFHKWVMINDCIYAIVERKNGRMTTINMSNIKFVDQEEGKENERC